MTTWHHEAMTKVRFDYGGGFKTWEMEYDRNENERLKILECRLFFENGNDTFEKSGFRIK